MQSQSFMDNFSYANSVIRMQIRWFIGSHVRITVLNRDGVEPKGAQIDGNLLKFRPRHPVRVRVWICHVLQSNHKIEINHFEIIVHYLKRFTLDYCNTPSITTVYELPCQRSDSQRSINQKPINDLTTDNKLQFTSQKLGHFSIKCMFAKHCGWPQSRNGQHKEINRPTNHSLTVKWKVFKKIKRFKEKKKCMLKNAKSSRSLQLTEQNF